MLARRYHDERCQNRLAAASASVCVASRLLAGRGPGGQGLAGVDVGSSGAMWARLNASVTGHIAFDPNPSASRW